MSILVVGVSHQSAPMAVLDRVALTQHDVEALQATVMASPAVAEALVLSTCNRVEVYADVARFHAGVVDVTDALIKHTGVARDELVEHIYVRYDDRAVQHSFEVAAGLDSMVVGEAQVLGQVRHALREAQDSAAAGRVLNHVFQSALRAGKRVHTETGIDSSGASVVSVALDIASESLPDFDSVRALVVGAGAMSSLAARLLAKRGVDSLVIANRSADRAHTLARELGAEAKDLSDLADELSTVDLVVSCTGARGYLLDVAMLTSAMAQRTTSLVVVDLALPHDTEPAIADLDGVRRIDFADVSLRPGAAASVNDVNAAREIIAEEVADYIASIAAQDIEPIVVSLRARADEVVEAELQRLRLRLPAVSDAEMHEFERAIRRVMSTLLHTPTVRMKQFATDPEGRRYAEALHMLFDLDPSAVDRLTSLDVSTADVLTIDSATSEVTP